MNSCLGTMTSPPDLTAVAVSKFAAVGDLHCKFIDRRLDRSLWTFVTPGGLLQALDRFGREEMFACFFAYSRRDIFHNDNFVIHLKRVCYFRVLPGFSLHFVVSSL